MEAGAIADPVSINDATCPRLAPRGTLVPRSTLHPNRFTAELVLYVEWIGGVHAIDTRSSWSDGSPSTGVPYRPPIIVSGGNQVADLSEGFSETPKTYGVIFGVNR